MPDWLAITLALASPVLAVVATLATVSFTIGRRVGEIESVQIQHAKEIEARATVESTRGVNAYVKRVEAATTANMTRIEAVRTELHDRIERHSTRVDKVEESHATRETATAAILGKLEAGLASLKESVERLIAAEANQRRQPQTDFMQVLEMAKALTGK